MSGIVQNAYGLTLTGLAPVTELMPGPAAPDIRVRLSVDSETPAPPAQALDDGSGVRLLADGRTLRLDREAGTATFYGPPLTPDLIAHPYLAPVATTFARWSGREAFHAGAVVVGGAAYAVLGPRTAGKSTMMAALAAAGLSVLNDDILVTDGELAFPGPRCVDLREVPPIDGLQLGLARRGTRHRLFLPDRPPPVRLGGWVFLEWGDEIGLHRRGATEMVRDLLARRAWRTLGSDATRLLALAALPGWTLRRPRDWSRLAETVTQLSRTLDQESRRRPTAAMVTT